MATTPTSEQIFLTTSTISRVVLMTAEEWAQIEPRLTQEAIRWDSLLLLKTLLPAESADLVIQPNATCNYYVTMLAEAAAERFHLAQQERLTRR